MGRDCYINRSPTLKFSLQKVRRFVVCCWSLTLRVDLLMLTICTNMFLKSVNCFQICTFCRLVYYDALQYA